MPLLWSRSALSSRLQLSRMEKMLEALTSQPGLSPVGRVDFVCLSNTASLNEPCEEARKRCRHPQFRKSPLNCHKTRVAYAAPGQVPLLCQLSRPLRGRGPSVPACARATGRPQCFWDPHARWVKEPHPSVRGGWTRSMPPGSVTATVTILRSRESTMKS